MSEADRDQYLEELANDWTLSTTPMTEEQARTGAQMLRAAFDGVFVDPVDPREWLTLHLSQGPAEEILAGLRLFEEAGGDAGSLIETFEDFLSYCNPDPDDEPEAQGGV